MDFLFLYKRLDVFEYSTTTYLFYIHAKKNQKIAQRVHSHENEAKEGMNPSIALDPTTPSGKTILLLLSALSSVRETNCDRIAVQNNNSSAPIFESEQKGRLDGLVAVAKACCDFCSSSSSADDVNASAYFLGKTAEERLVVDDWLSSLFTTFSGAEFSSSSVDQTAALESLNEHLKTRSHVAINSRLTLADVALFAHVHDKVAEMSAGQMKQKKAMMRWFKRLQTLLLSEDEEQNKIFGEKPRVECLVVDVPFKFPLPATKAKSAGSGGEAKNKKNAEIAPPAAEAQREVDV